MGSRKMAIKITKVHLPKILLLINTVTLLIKNLINAKLCEYYTSYIRIIY